MTVLLKSRRAWVQVPSVVGHQRGAPIQLQFEDGSTGQGQVLKVDATKRRVQVELHTWMSALGETP